MIRAGEIQKLANKLGVRDSQIEKDYVIGWILKGVSQNVYLKKYLVFKGGTVLKKIWFDDYRFSEDMDFTFKGEVWDVGKLETEFQSIGNWIYKESRIILTIKPEESSETQYRCYIKYKGPLGGEKDIKCDISKDELIYYTEKENSILDQYTDAEQNNDYKILAYSLEESLAEKLRCVIQRTIPRDVYDVWYLTEIAGITTEDIAFGFQEKVEYKNLDPMSVLDVLKSKEKKYKANWEKSLKHQIADLPEFEEVWREILRNVRKLIDLLSS